MAEELGSPFFCDDPGPEGPRRVVTDVASMTAIKIGNPIAKFVLVKVDDGSLH